MSTQRGSDLRFPQGLVEDQPTREMFEIIRKFLLEAPMLQFRGKIFTIESKVAITSAKIKHSLGFRPLDALVLSKNGGTLTFLHDKFTESELFYTIGAGVSARVLIGTFGVN